MTRDACNAQKFVQNIGLTIAWKSPYPRSNINRRYIKPEEGGEGRYRILSCAARDYGKSRRQEVRYDLYLSATYHIITVFATAVNSRRQLPIFARLVIGGCCTISGSHVQRHISHSLFFSLFFS